MSSIKKIVGIIIPVHNRKSVTICCLKKLQEITSDSFVKKIVVVDDGSTDGTSTDVINDFTGIDIVYGNGNLWWTGSINLGLKYILKNYKIDFILIMNDDIEFDPDFIDRFILTASNEKNAIIGSITLDSNKKNQIVKAGMNCTNNILSPLKSNLAGKILDNHLPELLQVDSISGRSMFIPSSVLHKVGLFNDQRLPHNGGDHEFCARCRDYGIKLLIDTRSRIYTTVDSKKSIHHFLGHSSRIAFLHTLFDLRYPWHLKTIFWTAQIHKKIPLSFVFGCAAALNICKLALIKIIMPKKNLDSLLESRTYRGEDD